MCFSRMQKEQLNPHESAALVAFATNTVYLFLVLLGGNSGGDNTALGDGDITKELVQLLVVADGELNVSGDDSGLLVVTSSIAGQLEDLSSEVLEDGSKVDGRAGTYAGSISALSQEAGNSSDGELETSLGRARDRLLGVSSSSSLSSLSTLSTLGRHSLVLVSFSLFVWFVINYDAVQIQVEKVDEKKSNTAFLFFPFF